MQKVYATSQFGKQARHSFSHGRNVSTRFLDVIHSDDWGPTKTKYLVGSSYYVTFIDDHSQKVWIYFMKAKNEVFEHFKIFKNQVEKEMGMYMKCLQYDGGIEYFSHEIDRFLDEQGIIRHFTCIYMPQKNGVAERKNMNLMDMERCMVKIQSLPHGFWLEAVMCAAYVFNTSPTKAL